MAKRALRNPGVLLVTLLCAATLLALSVPRTVVAVINLPGNVWLSRLQQRDDVAVEQLKVLIDSRRAALVWTDSARLRNDLALATLWHTVEIEEGLNPFDDDDGSNRKVLQPAIEMIHDSLKLGPANPFAWHQLALAELYAGGVSPAVTKAIEMSILTGPNEPRIRTGRLELALISWPALDDDLRALVLDQIRATWTGPQQEVVRFAYELDRAHVIREALAGTRDDLIEFQENLEHYALQEQREAAEERAEEEAAEAAAGAPGDASDDGPATNPTAE